ncbi:MAG: tRNA uridine-5-carboxymethylaminomethyl(34) synthesis GTPase MnmE, partial [Abditibacteriota bacterium]|nr:tRNA uridine-5-carboxymethylaminomethyl(34) synthesis GTPase MnmE [Abditibacteriota bacterium]
MQSSQDTIAALSTPKGNAGMAVIRCSGSHAFAITNALFSRDLDKAPGNSLLHGFLRHKNGTVIDEAVVA